MAAPDEKLVSALQELEALQRDGARVFESSQLSRTARERLTASGFLQEVMRGWLISASPDVAPGDTTPWYASFWEFCRRYCESRFGQSWHLSPEQSLLLHAEKSSISPQVTICSPHAANNLVGLPFDTSFFVLKVSAMPAPRDLELKQGLRLFGVAPALTRVPASFFADHPVEAQVAIRAIRDPSPLLTQLLEGKHATVAGRLAGAFRRLGRPEIAEEIVATMRAAHHDVRERDPFETVVEQPRPKSAAQPIVERLQTLWASAREEVLAELPPAGRPPANLARALRGIDKIHEADAYHSLSIEGYQVTPELIERVTSGAWDRGTTRHDRSDRDALAARGYWLAFQRTRAFVERLLTGKAKLASLRTEHRALYRALFSPHVAVGALEAAMLAGYRSGPVFIRGSRHVPPRSEALSEATPALFDLIEREPAPGVRAVLGHWLLGYLHPFPDGNGRIARLLMNALFIAGGYPWTVIRVENRSEYLHALEEASVGNHLRPFAKLIAAHMRRSPSSPSRGLGARRRHKTPQRAKRPTPRRAR